jgi:signal transduction histidine kinase
VQRHAFDRSARPSLHSRTLSDDLPAAIRPALATGIPDDTLEEINRLWTIVRAFSNTAHDVNNAIQVIAGNAELLEARDLDPAVRRRIEVVRTEAARASTTINRLLSYAREPRVPGQTRDLRPFVESAVEMRMASASRRRIVLTYDRRETRPCLVVVDGRAALQIVLDLLLTAETQVAGHRNARVTVALERTAEDVVVRVAASSDGDGGGAAKAAGDAATEALTSDLQMWVAAHLAARHHAVVSVARMTGGCELTLTVPAVQPPG